jgi:hypothetical protein
MMALKLYMVGFGLSLFGFVVFRRIEFLSLTLLCFGLIIVEEYTLIVRHKLRSSDLNGEH